MFILNCSEDQKPIDHQNTKHQTHSSSVKLHSTTKNEIKLKLIFLLSKSYVILQPDIRNTTAAKNVRDFCFRILRELIKDNLSLSVLLCTVFSLHEAALWLYLAETQLVLLGIRESDWLSRCKRLSCVLLEIHEYDWFSHCFLFSCHGLVPVL